ncbi:MAG: arsenate reductase (glutaredoxin) [Alphaproteobacteria bacterium]|nr:arsenate reductase (glutaredoxin) [Alphaproteobacteria bacterium]NNF23211.1 arsenate reductase (glutaredoxin) [Paracoccaceae bacterium]
MTEIWHNPRCSKSRTTLSLLQEAGHEPQVRLYLSDPPSRGELRAISEKLGLPPSGFIRNSETLYKELGLAQQSEDALLDAMARNPILIERPIVVAGGKAAIGRPPEAVLRLF